MKGQLRWAMAIWWMVYLAAFLVVRRYMQDDYLATGVAGLIAVPVVIIIGVLFFAWRSPRQ